MSKKISLKQFLMKTGKFDRVEECLQLIRNGNVTINGKPVVNPNYFFNPKSSVVKLNNEKIKQVGKIYFLMNKTVGYLSQ